MKQDIVKVNSIIDELLLHSCSQTIHREISTDINDVESKELKIRFHFDIATFKNSYIREVRSIVRKLNRYAEYLSRADIASIYVDYDEYERCPVHSFPKKTSIGYVRGYIELQIGTWTDFSGYGIDFSANDNIQEFYNIMNKRFQ